MVAPHFFSQLVLLARLGLGLRGFLAWPSACVVEGPRTSPPALSPTISGRPTLPPQSIPGGVGQAPCLWGGARHDGPGQSCRIQSRQEMPLSRPRSNATRSECSRRDSLRVRAERIRSLARLASNCDAGASALQIVLSALRQHESCSWQYNACCPPWGKYRSLLLP